MIAMDLFAEFDRTAREYGWTALGQPERLTRRYGKGVTTVAGNTVQVTVRVYANRSGTAIVGARRTFVGERSNPMGDDLRGNVKGKRDTVLAWLRR